MAGRQGAVDPLDDASFIPRFMWEPIDASKFPTSAVAPRMAQSQIQGLRNLDATPRLNLASFVTTFMEPECRELMEDAIAVNYIDTEEYPSTEKIKEMCVSMLADLWHADLAASKPTGTDTVGSSEAVLLGGLAMLRRWSERRKAAGLDVSRPNIVMGRETHVVWEKLTNYFSIEPRWVDNRPGKYVAANEDLVAACDENTIGVVAILGTTYTGAFYDVEDLDARVAARNAETGWQLVIHVDGASGGFVAPFIYPDLKWDFRLPHVVSINASGHKYGLVYPGLGWVMWRSREYLPESLVFHDNYLGKDQITITLNFSKGAMNVVGQLYQFIRMGRDGYREINKHMLHTKAQLRAGLTALGAFELISEADKCLPLVAFHLKDVPGRAFDEFNLADRLRTSGWVVPAYTLAPSNQTRKARRGARRARGAAGRAGARARAARRGAARRRPYVGRPRQVLRVVCRWDFGPTMCAELLEDIKDALAWLDCHYIYTKDQLEAVQAKREAHAHKSRHWPSMDRLKSFTARGNRGANALVGRDCARTVDVALHGSLRPAAAAGGADGAAAPDGGGAAEPDAAGADAAPAAAAAAAAAHAAADGDVADADDDAPAGEPPSPGALCLQRVVHTAYWVFRHGPLVAGLDLASSDALHNGADEEAMLLAAAAPGLAPLRAALSLRRPDLALRSLDAAHLTRLAVSACDVYAAPSVCAQLSRLAQLRELALSTANDELELAPNFAAALAGAAQLSRLELDVRLPAPAYAELPVQLAAARLSCLPPGAALGHLAALSSLELSSPGCSARELAALGQLPSLTHLRLGYGWGDAEAAEAQAGAWAQLAALRELALEWQEEAPLSARLAAGLLGATRLSTLRMCVADLAPGVEAPALLAPLRGLRRLTLAARAPAGPLASLGRVLETALCRLTSLQLCWPEARLLALTQVYGATRLRLLLLTCEDVGDEGLFCIANNLAALRVLGLGACNVTVRGVLEALRGRGMPRLAQLLVADHGFGGPDLPGMTAVAEARLSVAFSGFTHESGAAERLDEYVLAALAAEEHGDDHGDACDPPSPPARRLN
ncbi:Glutamate decarboxylase [Scenedesmus sp. PABB004]|nr:Glutamate decarboxylase [Scenedesmus sp. PABB004]